MPGIDLLRPVAERAQTVRDQLLRDGINTRSSLNALCRMEQVIDEAFRQSRYWQVSQPLRKSWAAFTEGMPQAQENRWAACLLLDFIARSPERLHDFPAPESVLPQTARELSRIVCDSESNPENARNLDSDLFLKDLSLSRLDSFPCVAQIVEKRSGIPRRVVVREFGHAFRSLLRVGVTSGFRYSPFFELHTHTPMLSGFNPEGWDQCYLLIADLFVTYPEYHGVIGGSWYFDPLLDRVSPHLSYLRKTPTDWGAFLIRVGPTKADIANATANSETRRKLHEAGKYNPTSWLLVWPREALLEWAREKRR